MPADSLDDLARARGSKAVILLPRVFVAGVGQNRWGYFLAGGGSLLGGTIPFKRM